MAATRDRTAAERSADVTAVADQCSRAAEANATDALHQMAVSIAISENELSPAEGTEYLALETRGEKFESSLYPGDAIYSRARDRLRKVIGI